MKKRPRSRKLHVLVPRDRNVASHPLASHHLHQGDTPHFRVFYDAGLGDDGKTISAGILQTCELDYSTLQSAFSGISPVSLPFTVLVTSGSCGASHASCEATELSIGARSAPGVNTAFMRQLLITEEDEVFEANFGHGRDCGASAIRDRFMDMLLLL